MSEKKCCRACLKEIRNRTTFTNILLAPDPVVYLRDGEVPAVSYLHCYYFCLKPNNIQFNMENLADYSYICGTCKTILLKTVDFITTSQKNETFLKAMYDFRKDESIADNSDNSLDDSDIDMHTTYEEEEDPKSDIETDVLIEEYPDQTEIFEKESEEIKFHEFGIVSGEVNNEYDLMKDYSINIEEIKDDVEFEEYSPNTSLTPQNDDVSFKDEICDGFDEIAENTFEDISQLIETSEKDFEDKREESYDELEEIIKAARKKVLRSKMSKDEKVIKGSSKKVRGIKKPLEVDDKKWKVIPKESFNPGFKCILCRTNFDIQRHLFEHYDNEHDQSTLTFPCDICKRRHISQKALTFHKHSFHNNIIYEDCDTCGLSLLPTFFKAHKERHKTAVQYACKNCDRIFDRLCTLKQHHRAVHEKEKVRRYECPECDRHFFSEEKLNSHRMAHDENNDVSEVEFLCHICSKTFPRKTDLQLHLKVHSGNIIKCPHCAKEFVRLKDMEYHMRSHTKDFPYQCNICSQGFAVRWNLDAHLKKHQGLRYKCKICSREYIHLSGLREHTYQHLGYPLTCKLCGKGYAVKNKLRNHLKNAHRKRFEDEHSDSTIDGYMLRHRVKTLFDTKEEFIDEYAAE